MTTIIDKPMWIIAKVSSGILNVYRSPLVHEKTDMFKPVREHITEHGLVLAMSETFTDPHWMFGEFIAEVYAAPNTRADIMDSELRSEIFEACGVCDHFHDLDTKHLMTEPEQCEECTGFHRQTSQ